MRNATITCSTTSQASPQPELPLPLPLQPSSTIVFTFPPSTQPHQPASHYPSLPAATCRESNILQLSLSSHSASPFLLHKLPKQKSVAIVMWRSTLPADPASRSSHSGAQLARRPAPPGTTLVLHLLHFLPSLGAVHPQHLKPQENKDRK